MVDQNEQTAYLVYFPEGGRSIINVAKDAGPWAVAYLRFEHGHWNVVRIAASGDTESIHDPELQRSTAERVPLLNRLEWKAICQVEGISPKLIDDAYSFIDDLRAQGYSNAEIRAKIRWKHTKTDVAKKV